MTPEQKSKYLKAAQAYIDNLGDDPPDHRDVRSAFEAGAEHASKSLEQFKFAIELKKKAHNQAIDQVIDQLTLLDSLILDWRHVKSEIQKLKL